MKIAVVQTLAKTKAGRFTEPVVSWVMDKVVMASLGVHKIGLEFILALM